MQTAPAIPLLQSVAPNSEALRLEAYHIGESVLPIFEAIFPNILTPRMALPVALDVVNGIHDYHTMAVANEYLQGAIDDAHAATSEVGPDAVWDYHAACMAATTISLALAPVVDLGAVQHAASEALRWSSSPSRRTH
jgi:hypothetical protein